MLAQGKVKYCPSCEQEKPLSAFGKNRRRKDGLTVYCKECRNRKQRGKYQADPELRASKYAKTKQRYANDQEAHEQQLERQREWYREHYADPEYRAAENERFHQRWVNMDDDAREKRYTGARKRRKEKYASDADFKARIDAHNRRYYHQKRANGSYTIEQWQMLLDLCGNRCLRCGAVDSLEVDHIVPVSEGGSSDLVNLQPLCRSCNASKGTSITDYRTDEVATVIEAAYT